MRVWEEGDEWNWGWGFKLIIITIFIESLIYTSSVDYTIYMHKTPDIHVQIIIT